MDINNLLSDDELVESLMLDRTKTFSEKELLELLRKMFKNIIRSSGNSPYKYWDNMKKILFTRQIQLVSIKDKEHDLFQVIAKNPGILGLSQDETEKVKNFIVPYIFVFFIRITRPRIEENIINILRRFNREQIINYLLYIVYSTHEDTGYDYAFTLGLKNGFESVFSYILNLYVNGDYPREIWEGSRQNFVQSLSLLKRKLNLYRIDKQKLDVVSDIIKPEDDPGFDSSGIADLVAEFMFRKKSPRKSRKSPRKSRKSPRKSRKSPRKSRKSPKKSRKSTRKTRKSPKKSRKSTRKSQKSTRKSRKASRNIRKSK